MSSNFKRLFGLALCVVLTFCASTAARGGTREEAERLWELAVAAKGGRERLHSVGSILINTGTRKHPLIDLYAFPGRFWRWDAAPEPLRLAVQMSNAEQGAAYSARANRSPRKLGDDALAGFQHFVTEAQLYYLLETRWLKPTPVEATEGEVRGRRADVVRVLVGDKQADFFFDRKTRLPLKVVFPARGGARRYFEAQEYVEVNGLMLPSKVSYGLGFKSYTYVLNPDYDARVFERPPTVEAGPEAWRRGAGR